LSLSVKITVILFFLCTLNGTAQSQDTIAAKQEKMRGYTLTPIKATMYAAALPGLGQIYNRKYWKVPFVYAGFGALGYAISFNTTNYNKFMNAYQDFTDNSLTTDSYLEIEFVKSLDREVYDPILESENFNSSTSGWVKTQMMNGVDYYRKYRDLSYIGIAAWYLVTIIDANVDASLFDYDISDDLRASFAPVTLSATGLTPGITFSIVKTF